MVIFTIFGALMLMVLFGGHYNLVTLWELYREKEALSEKVEQLRVENQLLSDQIRALENDPRAIEKVARENLGMAGEGETVYRILPERGDSAADSAKSTR